MITQTRNELTDVLKRYWELTGPSANPKYWYPLSRTTFGTEEILQALDSMCRAQTTMGEKTAQFEADFCAFQESAHATMVNSGSSADLLMSYLLIDPVRPLLKPGDEILIPAVTWPTQFWSPMMAGLQVKLVDVDPQTLNIDIADLARKITPKTKALFVVHLMGNPCDMHAVRELVDKHKLILLEDCCEAMGSRFDGINVGNFGLASSFSFFFAHHMCTMEGGMITSNDPTIKDTIRMLRAHGWARNLSPDPDRLKGYDVDPRYAFIDWGFNVRPTEPQAGFGIEQLKKLPGFNARRIVLAERFFNAIKRYPVLEAPKAHPASRPAWFTLPLMIRPDASFTRGQITGYLEEQGIETRPIVVGNIARHPVSRLFPTLQDHTLAGANQIHDRGFYIGLTPMSSDQDMDRLLAVFDRFFAGQSSGR